MKIGVVGLGFMGSTHLQAYQGIPQVEIAAVSSSDPKKLQGDLSMIEGNLNRPGASLDFGAAARYEKAEDLIQDRKVEAVDLCTPTDLHAPLAIAALEAGKHVLVEKPMALSAEECDRIIAAAEKAGKVLMVAQVLRFWPDYVVARERAASGKLGPVKLAFFRRKCAAPGWGKWMHDRSRSGGGVFDLLIHDFDFCQWLFGKPQAVTATGIEEMEKGIDLVEAKLAYPGGAQVSISGGWHHPQAYPFSMEFSIVCEKGTLDFHSGLRRLTLYRHDGSAEKLELPATDGFQEELRAFVKACEKGEPPENCRPKDSAEAIRMTLAMRESREKNGQAVEVR